jgi:hypothetical protein
MKKTIRLTESDLSKIIKRVINEQDATKGDTQGGEEANKTTTPMRCPTSFYRILKQNQNTPLNIDKRDNVYLVKITDPKILNYPNYSFLGNVGCLSKGTISSDGTNSMTLTLTRQ